jgi:hypothetical protein
MIALLQIALWLVAAADVLAIAHELLHLSASAHHGRRTHA